MPDYYLLYKAILYSLLACRNKQELQEGQTIPAKGQYSMRNHIRKSSRVLQQQY